MRQVTDDQLKVLISDAFLNLGKTPYRSTNGDVIIDQADIVFAIVKSFIDDKSYVILRAPVGSGKSIIAAVTSIVVNDLCGINPDERLKPISILTTPTKILTDQYSDTFNGDRSIIVVKGAESFPCVLDGGENSSGADCINTKGELSGPFSQCAGCSYLNQRRRLTSNDTEIVVSTSHYTLTKLGKTAKGFGRSINLIVYDEAHLISDIYSSTFGIDISKMYLDRLAVELKDLVIQAKINSFQEPVEYETLVETLTNVKHILFGAYHDSEIREKFLDIKVSILNFVRYAETLSKAYSSIANDKPIPDYVKALNKTAKKLNNVLRACLLPVDYAEGYINIDTSSSDTTEASWTISPITPGEKGWSRVDQSRFTLFMSGTLDIDLLAIQLGVDPELLDIIDIPYAWDKMLKPVVTFRTNAYLNFRTLAKGSDVSVKLYKDIAKIVRFHQSQNESGIIITTSYAMSNEICTELDRLHINFINHKRGTEGVDSINAYSNIQAKGRPVVLVIPAMFEGFDGVHDLCRFVIIPKTPFANTQGPRSKALLEKYPALYAGETVNKLVQGFGRGVRKSNDWCVYYLMDKTVDRILNTLDQQYKAQFERVELNQPKDVVEFKKQFSQYLNQGV